MQRRFRHGFFSIPVNERSVKGDKGFFQGLFVASLFEVLILRNSESKHFSKRKRKSVENVTKKKCKYREKNDQNSRQMGR
jgi:hypothetical protein